MQKQKNKPGAMYVVLVLIAVILIGAYRTSTLLSKASADGIRYTANRLPITNWGWGSDNWKGQRLMDFCEAVDSDETVCATAKPCRVAVLQRYHAIIAGPVLITKRTTEYQP